MKYIFVIAIIFICKYSYASGKNINIDTTVIAKVIELDSFVDGNIFQRTGFKYYYGIFHVKIALVDITQNNSIIDTLVLAYVYNIFTDTILYRNSFNLEVDKYFVFIINKFTPSKSDFVKLQGRFSINDNWFYPVSNKIIKKYKHINRIIYCTKYK